MYHNNKDSSDVLLSVEKLSVEYTSDGAVVHAVNQVSFDIYRGKTLGLVGETGAGKTSIARAILRILPDFSTKSCTGHVVFQGQDLLALKEREMAKIRGKNISMIFQDPMTALNPVQYVGKQIAEGILLHNRVSQKQAYAAAKEMLEMVGIPAARFYDYPLQFSGGMKQRVIIAIALACKPELLLADEPTTALDVTIQAQVMEVIASLKKELGMSMLMITHDLGVVAEVCDEVAIVYAGEILEYGSLSEVFDHPSHPYTLGLFNSLPKIDSSEDLETIKGMPPDPTNLPAGCKFYPRCPRAARECAEKPIAFQTISGKHICRCLFSD